jgi:hypothetical protein
MPIASCDQRTPSSVDWVITGAKPTTPWPHAEHFAPDEPSHPTGLFEMRMVVRPSGNEGARPLLPQLVADRGLTSKPW